MKPVQTNEELEAVAAFVAEALQDSSRAIGYPRWETPQEVEAEYDVYGQDLRGGLFYWSRDGRLEAVSGFLGSPGDDAAFVVGPVCLESTPQRLVREFLTRVEALAAPGRRRLRACVLRENRRLLEVLQDSGYETYKSQIEMKAVVRDWQNRPRRSGSNWVVRPLDVSCPDEVRSAVDAVSAAADAADIDADDLQEYVEDGCRVSVAEVDGSVIGCCVFGRVSGTTFGRIEYVGVHTAHQSRGVGRSLVDDAMASCFGAGADEVFLSVDADRENARSLYGRCGFKETVVSLVLHKRLVHE